MDYYAEQNKKMSAADKKAYKNYENKERAENDVRILMEAQEVRGDKSRLKMAMHCAKMKKEQLSYAMMEGESSHNTKKSGMGY